MMEKVKKKREVTENCSLITRVSKSLRRLLEGFDVEQKREIKEKLKDHNNIHPETSTIHQNDPPIDCLYILHLRG